jgi:hypothetical protein
MDPPIGRRPQRRAGRRAGHVCLGGKGAAIAFRAKPLSLVFTCACALAFVALATFTIYRALTDPPRGPRNPIRPLLGWTGNWNVRGEWWIDWHISPTDVSAGFFNGHPQNIRYLLFDPDRQRVNYVRVLRPLPGVAWVVISGYTGRLHIKNWLVLTLLAMPPALTLWLRWRRRHLRGPGHCLQCGYDLRETPTRCPECGHQP